MPSEMHIQRQQLGMEDIIKCLMSELFIIKSENSNAWQYGND